ncbi:MATE family efflux transporter [Blautia hydrogenotrophica]|uniref:MATE family efflux transporter n=1 Tax=Blautia hydrogenotrophica TaxID=53443 RepID=UPI0002DD0FD7|nr:MATE family efflux transporter [Blautia hydrogenotrophica]
MDLLRGKIKNLYFKYLAAAFGSALITSIYSIVDMAMVGQYQGPEGVAALAVVAPIWNVIYSLGLLMGIGGSVIFSTLRGGKRNKKEDENEYFTAAVIGSVVLASLAWAGIICFERPVLLFFGAEEVTLSLAQVYLVPIKYVFPCFLFNQMLAAFLRNDKNPGLATGAVLSGGIFNVVGDYVFVFVLDMGIFGAGLATAMGSVITFLVMLTHFLTKRNTLALVRPFRALDKMRKIVITGFSTFFIDVAMGILTVLFNRQIVKYLGTDALAVYGVIVNVSTFVQCCAYSVGQAAQPIISINYGAKLGGQNQGDVEIFIGYGGIFQRILDSVDADGSKFVYQDIHESDTGGSANSAGNYTGLWNFLFVAATKYIFNLLFPGTDEAQGSVFCLSVQGNGDQRVVNSVFAGSFAARCTLDGNACDRAGGGSLRDGADEKIYEGAFNLLEFCCDKYI